MSDFPAQIRRLPKFDGPFDAFRLAGARCDVLFASYPAGTAIPMHNHDTENVGMITRGELVLIMDGAERRFGPGDWYHVPARAPHAARFEVATAEIEFWFRADGGGARGGMLSRRGHDASSSPSDEDLAVPSLNDQIRLPRQ